MAPYNHVGARIAWRWRYQGVDTVYTAHTHTLAVLTIGMRDGDGVRDGERRKPRRASPGLAAGVAVAAGVATAAPSRARQSNGEGLRLRAVHFPCRARGIHTCTATLDYSCMCNNPDTDRIFQNFMRICK